jgi:putative flippase GtrA
MASTAVAWLTIERYRLPVRRRLQGAPGRADSIRRMRRRAAAVRAWSQTTEGRKMVRYSMVSVIAVACSQFILAVCFGLFHWSAVNANITAVCLSAIPSYYLNRAWTWGKRGRSHLMKEIVPFWGMALLGLVFSTWLAGMAEDVATDVSSVRLVQTVIVMGASLTGFGILWVAKFMVLNKVLFAHREEIPAAVERS